MMNRVEIYLGTFVVLMEELAKEYDLDAEINARFRAAAHKRIPPDIPYEIEYTWWDDFVWARRSIRCFAIVHKDDHKKFNEYWLYHVAECDWCGLADYATEGGRCKGCNAPR